MQLWEKPFLLRKSFEKILPFLICVVCTGKKEYLILSHSKSLRYVEADFKILRMALKEDLFIVIHYSALDTANVFVQAANTEMNP